MSYNSEYLPFFFLMLLVAHHRHYGRIGETDASEHGMTRKIKYKINKKLTMNYELTNGNAPGRPIAAISIMAALAVLFSLPFSACRRIGKKLYVMWGMYPCQLLAVAYKEPW